MNLTGRMHMPIHAKRLMAGFAGSVFRLGIADVEALRAP